MVAGFCVEPNRFQSNTFSIRYFIQPLYIKFDYIDLSLGDVIGEWEYTEIDTSLDEYSNNSGIYLLPYQAIFSGYP